MMSPLAAGQAAVATAATTACTASALTAGGFVSAGISNGTLYMWGANNVGQLGVGFTSGGQPTPMPVVTTTGLVSPKSVWTWGGSSFAVDSSGQLWGWGDNYWGELGKPTTVKLFNSPIQITGPSHVVQASGSGADTMALTADGTVWGWGTSFYGGLGFVQSTPQTTPVVISGLSNIVGISVGSYTSVVLKGDGTVFGAGQNMAGELGLGSGVPQTSTFQPLPGLSNVIQVAINKQGNLSAFVVAVDQSGHVFAAGNNQDGEMGNGSPSSTNQVRFAQIPNLGSVVAVAAGDSHLLALKSDHTVWAWGSNSYGQLGDGTTNDRASPLQVSFPAGTRLVGVAAGFSHSMALDSNGNLWSWGSNFLGQLGTGAISTLSTNPVKVALGPVAAPACAPTGYQPSINGYAFVNPANPKPPSFDRMAAFYPSSKWEMYYPIRGGHTWWADKFYKEYFLPDYVGAPGFAGGLCYGMAASDQFLYNEFPNKSAVTLYPAALGLDSPFPGDLGASPSPSDATIQDFIDRYHSRQLAAAGVLASIDSWKNIERNGGNRGALSVIADAVASGKTEWIGLGPSQAALTQEGQTRFQFLFNESHAVLAYSVDKAAMQIRVYDPNAPLDNHAYIQIVDSTMNPGGGIELVHHADQPPTEITYGSGKSTGQDLGQPGEWTMVPLPEKAFSDDGIVFGQDNRHWALDALPEIAVAAAGGIPLPYAGVPIYRILGVRTPDQTFMEYLPSNTALTGVVTATGPGSSTTLATNMHTTEATQTDPAAAGTTHRISIRPNADGLTLTDASAAEQFTFQLSADFLASDYGRQITISGARLIPGGTLDLSVDPTFSSLSLAPSAMPAEQAGLTLAQRGQGAGSVTVTLTIPGNGAAGNVFAGDWTSLSTSLVFEVITRADGRVTGILLQDNPAQRQALSATLLQSIQNGIAKIADDGVRASLESKLDNASRQAGHSPGAAANMLDAMRNEIAAQNGKAIDPGLAASLDSTLREEIGLLRAPLA